jgi:tetratricopeptide (TPR) repeat protein
MSNEALIDTVLDRYFEKQISPQEAIQALQLADVDEPESTLQGYHTAFVAVQRYEVVETVAAVHRSYMMSQSFVRRDTAQTVSYNWRRPLGLTLKVASVVLVLMASWLGYQTLTVNNDEVFKEFYQPYTISTQRDATTAGDDDLVSLVRSRKYQEAVQFYQKMKPISSREKFLGGYAALETAEYQLAIQCFTEILANNPTQSLKLYNDEAEFYLGLTYIKAGQPGNAIPLFQRIYDDPGHTYHERVTSWDLFRLKRLD